MTYHRIERDAAAHGLALMGALHPGVVGARGLTGGTLLLLGAAAGFWTMFRAAPEAKDNLPDPIDRWSTRIIQDLAARHHATAIFPFGGPPYAPFIDWALKSGRAFSSPTGMLVHDVAGMMISYRGALHVAEHLPLPKIAARHPCADCPDQPCTTACPVGALADKQPYDVARCHDYLDTTAGHDCMDHGCATRRACPISQRFNRNPAQSALHMKAFHPR